MQVSIGIAAAFVLVLVLGVLFYRQRAARLALARAPKRAHDIEARMGNVIAGPKRKYGDIFVAYVVWKSDRETRLELVAGAPWKRLNEFTRALVVRYMWRALESLAGGSVVLIDSPPQQWDESIDAEFHDQGFDWKTFGDGPQFAKET